MYGFLRKYWTVLMLLGIGVVVCLANYTPGTFLSGWDTLHPEFNFPLAFERAFNGVLRPEQGVGAVAAHSHMADLPRIIFLSFLSPLIPMSFLRYSYIFLCFLLGPLGMYIFLRHLISDKKVCFLGGIFYMLNIGTVQLFYVPFEMFVTQFATLPFLFFFAADYLFTKKKLSLFGFVLVAIFSSPVAFAATLWYVEFLVFLLFCLILAFFLKKKMSQKGIFVSVFYLLILFVAVNLYWIFPNLYFTSWHGKEVTSALSNQLFSEEAFFYNKAFADFTSIALMKTFYFAWHIYSDQTITGLMTAWTQRSFLVPVIGFLFFFISLFGLAEGIKKQKIVFISLIPGLLLCLFFLLNATLPLYTLFAKLPLFQEAFRFPDDKVLGIFVFIYSIFFSLGVSFLADYIKRVRLRKVYFILLFLFIVFSVWPVFRGELIHPAMRISVPSEYFSAFNLLNSKPYGRIANFPIYSPFGWQYYAWPDQKDSFQGSGFLSFGLKDALMDRDYDRWNSKNESYYKEMSYALYTQNHQLFEAVLRKYQITYILLDTSIIAPGLGYKTLFYPELKEMILKANAKQIASFNNHIFIYQTPFLFNNSLLSYSDSLPVGQSSSTSFIDNSYLQNQNYVALDTGDITDNLDRVTTLPTVQTTSFTRDFFFTLKNRVINSCPSQNPTQNTKKITSLLRPFITFTSSEGNFCDQINILIPKPNTQLILTIDSKHVSGLPLLLCITIPGNGHCFVQTKLPETPILTSTSFLIPPLPSRQITITLTNTGIPHTTSINQIYSFSLEEMPNQNLSALTSLTQKLNPLPIQTYHNNSLYIFYLPNIQPNSTIILSQNYEPNWQLYEIDTRVPNFLARTFPFLVGKYIGTHVLVNSWENGWTLKNDQVSITNNKFVIVFLPQYLEYFGFGIGLMIVSLILMREGTKSFHFYKK